MTPIVQFESFSGSSVSLNTSDCVQILRLPSREELAELFCEFRRRQLDWLQSYLLEPCEKGGLIFGLGASKVLQRPHGSKGSERRVVASTARISIDKISASSWQILSNVATLKNGASTTRIFNANIGQQQAFLRDAMGSSLESIGQLLRGSYLDCLIYPWLATTFGQFCEPKEFLAELIERAAYERSREREGKRDFLRNSVPDLFLFWLVQHGIVLLPMKRQQVIGESRGFDECLISPHLVLAWKTVESAYVNSKRKHHEKWLERIQVAFRILVSASTMKSAEDLSLEMFQAAYSQFDCRMGIQLADVLHRIYRPLRDSLGRRELPTFKPYRSATPTLEHPFSWTYLATQDYPRSTFPPQMVGDYRPLPHVCSWGEIFAKQMAKLPIKSIGNSISTCQKFLLWLIECDIQISKLEDLNRELINDGKPVKDSKCFRSYLVRDGMKLETANGNILRLAWTFESIIEDEYLQISNPVSTRFDTFKVPTARGKTPRRPIGRDLLNFLRELNRRDDYAFSRSCGLHYRERLNASGHYESEWFPGFAVLVELLLELPMRGYGARFLDSGEGDESVVNVKSQPFQFQKNYLGTATKGRREGVFYTFESSLGVPMLGIYVNTNKTALDRESGYEIPWCSDSLRESLGMLRDWQIQNNPVARPVPCIEKHEYDATLNPDVIASLKLSYPLFRDPSDPRGWPISRDKVFDYWSRLLSAAEDELASKGIRIRLTEERAISKGPNKKPVIKRVAAYDIHTLRVSGITALLEAGMPPDMVQDVSGHATIVMALYYNKIKASRLNESLLNALNKINSSLDSIDGMSEVEFEHLSEFLVNTRAVEDATGKALLGQRRGHGDGAIDVTMHGICAAGECSTGGEFLNQAVGYGPVPRPLACSLCRYRVTGPMFLAGLVLNANRLMHELRSKGKEVAHLNLERASLEDLGKSTHLNKAKIEDLYREIDVVAQEWAAEVQYVHLAENMFDRYSQDCVGINGGEFALVTGLDGPAIESRLTRQSEFGLLQSLAEGAVFWPGFRPTAAVGEHREFLNELLAASDLTPFLLKLHGDLRDRAAASLGHVIVSLVPDAEIEKLHSGQTRLSQHPAANALILELREKALSAGSVDEFRLSLNSSVLEEF